MTTENNFHPQSISTLLQTLAANDKVQWPLTGSSMGRTLPSGCTLTIAPPTSPLTLGAILVFIQGETLFAHRLVARHRGVDGQLRLITQGDGRRRADPPIHPYQVLGQVTAAWQKERRIWPRSYSPWPWILRHHLLKIAYVLRDFLRG